MENKISFPSSYDLSRFDQFIDFECRLLDFLNNMSSTLGTQFRIPCGGKLSEALQFVSCVAMSHKQAAAAYRPAAERTLETAAVGGKLPVSYRGTSCFDNCQFRCDRTDGHSDGMML